MDHNDDDNKGTASEYVLILARVYITFAIGALVLYFILKAIESHKVRVFVTASYRVPIEQDEALQYEKGHPHPSKEAVDVQ